MSRRRFGRGTETRFRIRIHYTEPGYARRNGEPERRYRYSYDVSALTLEEAEEIAVEDFHEMTKLSQVGWERKIIKIEHLPYM